MSAYRRMGVSAYASSEQLGGALLAMRGFSLKKSAKSVEFTSALATVNESTSAFAHGITYRTF